MSPGVVVNIRGTSGCGKSTVVREVMKRFPTKINVRVAGRKQPLGYILTGAGTVPLSVIGHYETACGGCDTIPSYDAIFEAVRKAYAGGMNVLFEGLLLSAEVNRTAQLHKDGLPLHVIALEVPLEVCLDSVNARRRAKDPSKPPVNPANTESKWRQTKLSMNRLQAEGVTTSWLGREAAVSHIVKLLGLPW